MRISALTFILASAALVGLALFSTDSRSADAGGGGPADAISIDLDTTGNAANELGERESCIEVEAGVDVVFDITIEGVPAFVDNPPVGVYGAEDSDGINSFSANLNFDSSAMGVAAADASQTIIGVNAGSSVFDASDAVPDASSPWIASALDTGAAALESGDGILTRVTVAVDADAPDGAYELTLTDAAHGTIDPFYIPEDINNGTIAVGISCEEVPTPGPGITKGDNQCDSDVDAVDALQGLRFVAGLPTVQEAGCPLIGSDFASIFGDVDCDDDVDAVDSLRILQFIASIPVSLPAGCPPIGI